MQLESTLKIILRVSNFRIMLSFWYKQDIRLGQNVKKNLIGSLKSGIVINVVDYGDTMRDTELAANVSRFTIMEDHLPSSSRLLPEQKQQEVVEEDEGQQHAATLDTNRNCVIEITNLSSVYCLRFPK